MPRKRVLRELKSLPAPSDYAKPHKYLEEKETPPINHHRPHNLSDIPIQFFHNIFDKFLWMVKELRDQQDNLAKYIKLVEELAPTISELMEDEKERDNVMRKFMKYIGINLVPIDMSNCRTDGTMLKDTSKTSFMLCNFEGKTNYGTGACAYLQNACYYAKFLGDAWTDYEDLYSCTCFPAFLILLEGKRI